MAECGGHGRFSAAVWDLILVGVGCLVQSYTPEIEMWELFPAGGRCAYFLGRRQNYGGRARRNAPQARRRWATDRREVLGGGRVIMLAIVV